MAKRPENMTADERLTRIRTLERQLQEARHAFDRADDERASTDRWAREAWAEVRRLHDVCKQHWDEKQAIRVAAGLDAQPSMVPLAKFNHDTREWEPIHA